MNTEHAAIKRAKEIVRAVEWEGDLRANMTRVIGAGRVLANRLDELDPYIPSDDGEPITREWMAQEYGACDVEVPPHLGVGLDQDNAVFLEIATKWRYAQTRLPHIKTRGQLRQLLAGFGWKEERQS